MMDSEAGESIYIQYSARSLPTYNPVRCMCISGLETLYDGTTPGQPSQARWDQIRRLLTRVKHSHMFPAIVSHRLVRRADSRERAKTVCRHDTTISNSCRRIGVDTMGRADVKTKHKIRPANERPGMTASWVRQGRVWVGLFTCSLRYSRPTGSLKRDERVILQTSKPTALPPCRPTLTQFDILQRRRRE